MKIAVVGGGIGGLMTAALLERDGYDLTVFERSPELREIGAGIAVLSNGVKALSELLGAHPFKSHSPVRQFVISTAAGKDLAHIPYRNVSESLGFPGYIITRSELQKTLLDCVSQSAVKTGVSVRAVTDEGKRPVVYFEDGDSASFDLVIGADGVKSAVRRSLHGQRRFRYSGDMCYRAIVPYQSTDFGLNREIYGASGKRFGIHPVSGSEVYLWAVIPGTERLSRDDLRKEFSGWAFGIPELLERCSPGTMICNPIFDMKPQKQWGRKKVTLLGDAAHPTTPNLAQGGNMALEDAVVLSHCLKHIGDPEKALRQYEMIRIPRTSRLVKESRQFGVLGSLRNPALGFIRDSLYQAVPRGFFHRMMIRRLTFDFGY